MDKLSTSSTNNLNNITPTLKKSGYLERRFGKSKAKKIEQCGFYIQHIIMETALPLILYFTLKDRIGQLYASIVSSVPPLISSIFTIICHRRFEPLPMMIIAFFFISLGLSLGFNNPKLTKIKTAVSVGAIGIAYFVSLCFWKPLAFYFSRPWVTENDPEKIKEWNAKWEIPEFRKAMQVTSVTCGSSFILQAIINAVLLVTVSLDLIMILSPVITAANFGLLAIWNVWYVMRSKELYEIHTTQEQV